jgi:hypothetical protein
MQTSIKPELIATGEPQKIVADLQPFNKAKEQVSLTVAELNKSIVIKSKEQLDEAMAILSIASKVEKAIEKKRKELVQPFNDGAGSINAHAKEITSGLPAAIAKVKAAVLKFQQEEEAKALELKKQARIKQLEGMGFVYYGPREIFEHEHTTLPEYALSYDDKLWLTTIEGLLAKIQLQEEAKIQALQEEDPELADLLGYAHESPEPLAVMPAPSTAYFTPPALKGAAKVWKFKITDTSQVPKEYLIVDETAIRRAVGAGVREIAGVEIFQEDQLRIR